MTSDKIVAVLVVLADKTAKTATTKHPQNSFGCFITVFYRLISTAEDGAVVTTVLQAQ